MENDKKGGGISGKCEKENDNKKAVKQGNSAGISKQVLDAAIKVVANMNSFRGKSKIICKIREKDFVFYSYDIS